MSQQAINVGYAEAGSDYASLPCRKPKIRIIIGILFTRVEDHFHC